MRKKMNIDQITYVQDIRKKNAITTLICLNKNEVT